MDRADIEELLKMYDIGKKPLARLLGWGETTIMKYVDGEKPSGEYAKKLQTLKDNKFVYCELLEKGKNDITELAYIKSKRAVMGLLYATDVEKAAQFIVNYADADIAPGNIQLILYYSQFFYAAIYGKNLLNTGEKMQFDGNRLTPYQEIYDRMKKYGMCIVDSEYIELNDEIKEIIPLVHQILNGYSINAIRAVNNYEKKYLIHTKQMQTQSEYEILKDYFTKFCAENDVKNINGIKIYFEKVLRTISQSRK